MNATVNKILHGIILAVFLVAGMGSTLTHFQAFLPPVWYQDAQNIVTVCTGLVLYALSSPFLKPWLPTVPPQTEKSASSRPTLPEV